MQIYIYIHTYVYISMYLCIRIFSKNRGTSTHHDPCYDKLWDSQQGPPSQILEPPPCMCTCVCIYIYICVCIYICTCVYVYTYTYVCTYVYIYIYSQIDTYICIYTCFTVRASTQAMNTEASADLELLRDARLAASHGGATTVGALRGPYYTIGYLVHHMH